MARTWTCTVSGMADVAKLTGNGIEVTVISNDNDNKADFVIVTRMIAGKVSAYNAKGNDGDGYITVTAFPIPTRRLNKVASIAAADRISGAEFADIKGVEDVAKDDIVLYYRVGDTFYMEKAESVNITVTSTKGDDQIKDGSDTYKRLPPCLPSLMMTTLIPWPGLWTWTTRSPCIWTTSATWCTPTP